MGVRLVSLLSSRLRVLALGASALALSACASLPSMGPAPQPKRAADYATRESFSARGRPWPADDWWRAYGDAEFDRLIDEGLKGSPDLAAAQARLHRAEAFVAQARAAQLPHLGAQASVEATKLSYNNGIPPAFTPHGVNGAGLLGLDFGYELDFWGKNRSAVAAAVSDARAADAEAAEARLLLSTGIATAYADLVRLYAERDVAEEDLRVRQDTETLVSNRVANGLDTRAELSQAKAGAPTARQDIAAIDEEIALTKNRIAALMGQGPDRALSIGRPAAERVQAFGLPADLAADLIGRRPDVAAARWRAEAAARRIGVAKARFYPNVNLVALAGFQSLGLSKLFASGSSILQAGPAVTLPIFEGGALRANLKGARADYDEAVATYDGALTQALQQVADAAASERALGERLDQARQALDANLDAYRTASLRYRGGLSNYQSVLLAEDAMLQSRRTVAQLEARAFALDIALIKALGGGFTAPTRA
jgi:NodT family efflux transporter outer membrane factor (OMF) lipoprotein